MSKPQYQLKAEFFKTLGHPARIRVLELLSGREHAVAEMVSQVGVEPANLSQQLVASPRHADALLVTGVVTRNMAEPPRSFPTSR